MKFRKSRTKVPVATKPIKKKPRRPLIKFNKDQFKNNLFCKIPRSANKEIRKI
jgi:hypothetical protein